MRKSMATALMVGVSIILSGSLSSAEVLVAAVEFDQPVLVGTEIGQLLEVPGARLLGSPGEPLLPRKTLFFVVPYGQKPVDLQIRDLVSEPLSGVYAIAPAQLPTPMLDGFEARYTAPDPDIYNSDEAQPGSWIEAGSLQFKKGYALYSVTIHPLSYRPHSGLVDRLVSANVVLTTKPGGSLSTLLRADKRDLAGIERLADQKLSLSSYPAQPPRGPNRLDPGEYEYLIVTPELFTGIGGANRRCQCQTGF